MASDKNLANISFESSESVLQPVLQICANSRARLGLGLALSELIIDQYSFCFVSSRRSQSRG